MLTVRHRTASGDLSNCWEFDPQRRVVELVLRLGSAEPFAVTVAVCHPDRPRAHSHPILRMSGESWRILPAMFVPSFSVYRDRERSRLDPFDCTIRLPCDLHERIGMRQIVLTNTPPEQDEELEELRHG